MENQIVIKLDQKQLKKIMQVFASISFRSAALIAEAIYNSGKLGKWEEEPSWETKAEESDELSFEMLMNYLDRDAGDLDEDGDEEDGNGASWSISLIEPVERGL